MFCDPFFILSKECSLLKACTRKRNLNGFHQEIHLTYLTYKLYIYSPWSTGKSLKTSWNGSQSDVWLLQLLRVVKCQSIFGYSLENWPYSANNPVSADKPISAGEFERANQITVPSSLLHYSLCQFVMRTPIIHLWMFISLVNFVCHL